ncbi:MAG: SDR family NAD(P)-dependent oxidoreductase [Bryobacteraceae bacterium]
MALVTGAGRGIGRGCALELARAGAHLVISDVNLPNAEAVAREVAALGRQTLAIGVDVSSEDQVNEMVRQAVERFSRVDILVNNAGIVTTGRVTEITVETWDRTMAVNLKGVFLCSKAVFPLMIRQQDGRIINIASVAGKRGGGLHGNSCYAASKGGVIAFTKSLAREGGPYNVRVNAITPALIQTDMLDGLTQDKFEQIIEALPLRRAGTPQDVAAAACFLASDASAFMTGEIMDVDGGLMMD